MKQSIAHFALVVKDYDDAISFYTETLNFTLIEDTVLSDSKRWVLIAPPHSNGTCVLLAKASNERQLSSVGNQTGGRVGFFLFTDDFWRDYREMQSKSVIFVRDAIEEAHGTVAVFQDIYGNLWDLIQPSDKNACKIKF